MRILPIVIIFLIIGGFIIATSYNLNLKISEDRRTFIGKFSIWTVNVGKNLVRTVGYAVKLDWLPETDDADKEERVIDYANYVIDE